ncbi:MAG: TAXI family TRAP transporter solute-binding subunit [Planctomycetaceae bacterium]|nr:TAXI family TRAP transporter solute-binding subunit [Planctomycetales bacterium]MCB9927519.1 TAXI family TRAP transporter solute-binding subunit [Planctomycetaceae bacterium]
MPFVATKTLGRWLTWSMVAVLVVSVTIWIVRRETVPSKIVIATGEEGGLYFALGADLKASLQRRLRREPEVVATAGSIENVDLLRSGGADLAIVQGGATALDDLTVITPLYPELVLVIVRKERGIEAMPDLLGRNVTLGREGSGMRASAVSLLARFKIQPEEFGNNDLYFRQLLDTPGLDAAIVTTGIENRDVNEVLETNQFTLLPVVDASAVEMRDPYFRRMEIPPGLFSERPAVPAQPTLTLATTAYLVARHDAHPDLVDAALAAIHEENLRLRVPTLIPRHESMRWVSTRLHSEAHRYFHPSDDIGFMANVMESLAAGKELLFALGAGIYLLWHRWKRLRDRETQEIIRRQKDHLDQFLEETLRIEAAQMNTTDVEKLQKYLDDVTRIKLKALHEFTEEELRGDRSFSIFLTQCANLISKIQLKIVSQGRG